MKRDIHETALRQFDDIMAVVQEERALCLQDRRFAFIAGAQWEGAGWEDMSENMIRVEVNKTARGLKKIEDDYRANRVTVNYRAVGDADEDTAALLDGMFRADAYRCKAPQAFDNAFIEGASGGMGAWSLSNEFEDEYDPDNDAQRIRFDAIVDADQSVFFDLNSKLYDKSDAQYCFVKIAMAREAFEETYPDASAASSWADGLWKPHFDWYTPDVVNVVKYYRIEEVADTLRRFVHPVTGEEQKHWLSEIDKAAADDLIAQGFREQPARKMKRRRVARYLFSGMDELEPKQFVAGSCIPVVPFYGRRVWIDNVERVQGHVRQAKDPQRIYNTNISKLVETAALAPREVPVFHPAEIAGLETHWAEQNVKRHPYALRNPMVDLEGNELPGGPLVTIQPPQLQPGQAALIQITAADIAELTAADDSSEQVRSNVSAEAMDIAATRMDAKSATYMDNFRQSMQRCGEIYLEMARDVYFEEGRKVETMGEDGEQGEATLMEPFTDERGGYSIRHDLARGKFKVISDVTEATTTRRDKTVKTCLNGAQIVGATDPELANALITTAFMNVDGEGIDDLKDWLRKRAVQSGLMKPTKEEQQELDQAQQGQQPDPAQIALLAQAQEFQASSKLKDAQAGKAVADTGLAKAKTVETLASAHQKGADAAAIERGSHLSVVTGVEGMRQQRIKTGHEIAQGERDAA